MPEEDLNALLNPPNYLDQIDDGAFEIKLVTNCKSILILH